MVFKRFVFYGDYKFVLFINIGFVLFIGEMIDFWKVFFLCDLGDF